MSDAINHPKYYNRGEVEVIEFIEDWSMPFALGSFVKYVCRAGLKDDAIQDLEKAKWYIRRFVSHFHLCDEDCFCYHQYEWRIFANEQGLRHELCIAMEQAGNMIKGTEEDIQLYLEDIIMLLDMAICNIKKEREQSIENGVVEMGV